jgi:uncharacterized membrane protein YccC
MIAVRREPFVQVVKATVATILAWYIALLVAPDEVPVFAAIAAVVVVQPSVNQSLGKGLERSLGVFVGVIIGFGVGYVCGQQDWSILLATLLGIIAAWAFRLTPGSSVQIPISAMLVLAIGNATPHYAFARALETVIGAVVAITINALIVPPVALTPLSKVRDLGFTTASTLDRLATALTTIQTPATLDNLLTTSRELRPLEHAAGEAIKNSEESLTFNPRRSRHRATVKAHAELFARMKSIDNQTLGMTRAFCDNYDADFPHEPTLKAISQELERAAHDLRILIQHTTRNPTELPPITSELPALTSPLSIPMPHPQHWIFIGSLMEDLRRIRHEIVGE